MAHHQHCMHCHHTPAAMRAANSTVVDQQPSRHYSIGTSFTRVDIHGFVLETHSNNSVAPPDHRCVEAMDHTYYRQGVPVSNITAYHQQLGPSENDVNSPNMLIQPGPWPAPEYPRPGTSSSMNDNMGSFLHPGHHNSMGGHHFNYNAMPTSQASLDPTHWVPALLTPDQSPHTATLSVPEEHDFNSEPPRPYSPPVHEKMKLISRALESSSPVQRPDGVRKKNAKFDIPTGITIENIDSLIKREPDEVKAKELRGQKRLLKNREAALQSRARKKARAEQLEVENGHYKDLIQRLQIELQTRQHLECRAADPDKFDKQIHGLNETIRELRQENTLLRSQFQNVYRASAAGVINPNTYSNEHDEMTSVAFESQNFELFNVDFSIDSDLNAVKEEPNNGAATGKTNISASNLLTLLMYGAHIANITKQAQSGPMVFPVLDGDDYAASSSLLQAVFNSGESTSRTQPLPSVPKSAGVDLRKLLAAAKPHTVERFQTLCNSSSNQPGACISRIT